MKKAIFFLWMLECFMGHDHNHDEEEDQDLTHHNHHHHHHHHHHDHNEHEIKRQKDYNELSSTSTISSSTDVAETNKKVLPKSLVEVKTNKKPKNFLKLFKSNKIKKK